MTSIISFDPIPVDVPLGKIFKRLGYHRGITTMALHQREEISGYIEEALSLIKLKGRALRLFIEHDKAHGIVLAGHGVFASKKLADFLAHCQEIVIIGATAGSDIMDAVYADASGGNMTRGVVLDAVASEMVDASLDWSMKYFNRILLREKRRLLKKRFSAGYGDFSLENQKLIYKLLNLDQIGVAITGDYILIPEKSVTAISGIEKI